jgi:serpin B
MRTAALFQAGSSVDINESFQDMLEQYYFARVVKGDMNDTMQQDIDRWCHERTEGIINSFPSKIHSAITVSWAHSGDMKRNEASSEKTF